MHADLQEAIDFHAAIVAEGAKALVGYEREKVLANTVLLSEIPTTYDAEENRQVNAGNLLLRGVPGVGKTFFGVILAAISGAKFARLQGRADLQPTEVVGFQMINPATGQFITEFGPLASAEVILLDEINRIPLKSQSAFLEGLQDRTVTVGKDTYRLPSFSFAIATMNPIELGQGTFPLSEAATDRFAIMVNIGYLPPEEEQRLVGFDFKRVSLDGLMSKERVVELRSSITERVFLHDAIAQYIQRLVAASRPYDEETDWLRRSPSELVERYVDLGGSPRATICWGRLVKVWSLLARGRAEVYPEDVQDLAGYVLGHRIWAGAARGRPGGLGRRGHRRDHRAGAHSVSARAGEELVSWTEVQDIELVIVRRMREYMAGAHQSVFHGAGFEFAGLRDWQPGDRLTSIDWPQSTLTNFSPLVSREFEQQSTARLVIVADTSLSTRCGAAGEPIATDIARSVATLALAGAFFQDMVGLITFDARSRRLLVRPQVGRNHAIHCLEAYQDLVLERSKHEPRRVDDSFLGLLRKPSMVPVVSDFLFEDTDTLLGELLALNATHDVFVVLIDSRHAFDVPALSAGWVEGCDVETGESRLLSADDVRRLGERVGAWQDEVEAQAAGLGLEVLRLGGDAERFHHRVVEFLADRRLRKR